jgi:hypothetical protein
LTDGNFKQWTAKWFAKAPERAKIHQSSSSEEEEN